MQCTLNENLTVEERSNIHFTNGWLYDFKKRNHFKCFKSHGESGDADHAAATAELPQLRRIVAQHSANDVYNADEFGLYYSCAPNATIGPAPLCGRKKSKERVTFLVCTNILGTDRLPFG